MQQAQPGPIISSHRCNGRRCEKNCTLEHSVRNIAAELGVVRDADETSRRGAPTSTKSLILSSIGPAE